MVLLQDLSNFAEIPSTPVAFLELDLLIKACMLTAVVGLKLKAGQTTVSLIVLTLGCVSIYTKQDLEQLNSLHPAYHGTGVATIDNRDCLYHGHPRDGCPSYGGSNLTGSSPTLSLIWTG